jgi:hypothetical protein
MPAATAATQADQQRGAVILRKHFLQRGKDNRHGLRSHATNAFHEPLAIDRSHLVQRDKTGAILKATGNSPRVHLSACRHRCDDCRSQVLVQLVGDTITQGRVFLISLPRVGSRLTK